MSSSKAPKFTKDELKTLKLWDIPGVAHDGCDDEEEQEELLPVLTVEEIEAIQKQAYEEGFSQGKEEGFKQGKEEGLTAGYEEGLDKGYQENKQLLKDQSEQMKALMATLSEPFKDLDEQVENELLKLAIAIATQIIRREIKLDPGQVIAAVRAGVKVMPLASQKLILSLHPEDAELVRTSLALDEATPWHINEDPLITHGGCKVDTEQSHVDVTVENQLASVIAKVLGGVRGEDEQHDTNS